jgi:Flp pilus assembly protein TadB
MVGCFLDLVVLALAGGLGIEGALHAAAGISDSPVSLQLVGALDVARDSGDTPWEALAGLGRELGVTELVELASAVNLAGTEGARIKSTLAAKAASIRRHELAEAETDANTITDRLFIPGVLLLVGFLIFIGYPAVARLSAGL